MKTFAIPARNQVSDNNKAVFDNLNKAIGMVPNLYATMAYSGNALGNYVTFQGAKSHYAARRKRSLT